MSKAWEVDNRQHGGICRTHCCRSGLQCWATVLKLNKCEVIWIYHSIQLGCWYGAARPALLIATNGAVVQWCHETIRCRTLIARVFLCQRPVLLCCTSRSIMLLSMRYRRHRVFNARVRIFCTPHAAVFVRMQFLVGDDVIVMPVCKSPCCLPCATQDCLLTLHNKLSPRWWSVVCRMCSLLLVLCWFPYTMLSWFVVAYSGS